MNVETNVLERYSAGAESVQAELCCPVEYDTRLLAMLPQEIIDKDYGCGDPSRYIRPGDTVLDLGSGSGKICYMAAQLVGQGGQVIGVDMNDDMLTLARKYQPDMAKKLGEDRVRFVKGQIQDLALDLDSVNHYLSETPLNDAQALAEFQTWQTENPLIASHSVDLVISNCVLNLVQDSDKQQLVQEIFRVLKPGGRIAISDIVSDEPVPKQMKKDPDLWSGCISGAWEQRAFLDAFAEAGFAGVRADRWQTEPWRIVENIAFRSVTVVATKPYRITCCNNKKNHTTIYRGPYTEVTDHKGQIYRRGEPTAVNEPTSRLLTEGAYNNDFIVMNADGQIQSLEASQTEANCCG